MRKRYRLALVAAMACLASAAPGALAADVAAPALPARQEQALGQSFPRPPVDHPFVTVHGRLLVNLQVQAGCSVETAPAPAAASVRIVCTRSAPWLANVLPLDEKPDKPGEAFVDVPFQQDPLVLRSQAIPPHSGGSSSRLGLDF